MLTQTYLQQLKRVEPYLELWRDDKKFVELRAGQLRKLLRETPLSKDDLAAILKSGKISKEEIRGLLEEYIR